ncbi:hypothetical protein WISP_24891 [Willisornis vidua]|uniref:Kinesin motor domain-containing protein n=1 Tax=Willisornis vidua TaxID=1566151 RepID=A0ABQ9DRC0_9PASS|nr:hypothetical protein WISP_24891 [Willisornis vidua]
MIRIYGSEVHDPLKWKKQMRVLEDDKQQIRVVEPWEKEVTSVENVIKLIGMGSKCHMAGRTSANSQFSQSHAIFQTTPKKTGHFVGQVSPD